MLPTCVLGENLDPEEHPWEALLEQEAPLLTLPSPPSGGVLLEPKLAPIYTGAGIIAFLYDDTAPFSQDVVSDTSLPAVFADLVVEATGREQARSDVGLCDDALTSAVALNLSFCDDVFSMDAGTQTLGPSYADAGMQADLLFDAVRSSNQDPMTPEFVPLLLPPLCGAVAAEYSCDEVALPQGLGEACIEIGVLK